MRDVAHADQIENVGNAPPALGRRDPVLTQTEGDIGADIHMGKERIGLKHQIERAPMRGPCRYVTPIKADRAGVGAFKAGDEAQQRGLAASRRAEKGKKFAPPNGQVDRLQGTCGPEALAKMAQLQKRPVISHRPGARSCADGWTSSAIALDAGEEAIDQALRCLVIGRDGVEPRKGRRRGKNTGIVEHRFIDEFL